MKKPAARKTLRAELFEDDVAARCYRIRLIGERETWPLDGLMDKTTALNYVRRCLSDLGIKGRVRVSRKRKGK